MKRGKGLLFKIQKNHHQHHPVVLKAEMQPTSFQQAKVYLTVRASAPVCKRMPVGVHASVFTSAIMERAHIQKLEAY